MTSGLEAPDRRNQHRAGRHANDLRRDAAHHEALDCAVSVAPQRNEIRIDPLRMIK